MNTLSNDDTRFDKMIAVNSSYENETVYYSVFSTPQRKSVVVNGKEVAVESITLKQSGFVIKRTKPLCYYL